MRGRGKSSKWPPELSLQHGTIFFLALCIVKGSIAGPIPEHRRQTTQIKHVIREEHISFEPARGEGASHRMRQEQRLQGLPGLMAPGERLLR